MRKQLEMMLKHTTQAAILVFALALAPALALAQGSPGAAKYRQGRTLQSQNRFQDAIAQYLEAIKLEPKNPRYHVSKGDCEVKLKKYNEALASYREATTIKKDYAAGYVKQAQVYMKMKNDNGAIQALNAAYDAETAPDKRTNYKLIVVKLLLKQNRPQDAMAELNKVKAIVGGDDPRVLAAEGDVYLQMNNFAQATTSYQKAVDKVQGQPAAQTAKYYYGLGVANFKSGNAKKAEEAWANVKGTRYERRVRAFTTQSGARYYAAAASGYLKANVLDDAMEYANKAVQAEPNNAIGYRVLATVQMRKSQTALAIANFNKAAEYEKDEPKKNKLYSSMIRLQFNNGDYSGALNTANKILVKAPNNATVLGLKAQAEYQLGQFASAIKSTEGAIANVTPKNDAAKAAPYWFTQGLAAKKSGDVEKAKAAFKSSGVGIFRVAAKMETDKLSAR